MPERQVITDKLCSRAKGRPSVSFLSHRPNKTPVSARLGQAYFREQKKSSSLLVLSGTTDENIYSGSQPAANVMREVKKGLS